MDDAPDSAARAAHPETKVTIVPVSAPESTARDQDVVDESVLADPKFVACLERLEARFKKPKVKAPLLALTRLGRFEIRRELGRGRFGVVFLAWDPKLERQVALKVPQFDAAIDPELRERFRGEALSAGQLQHPGIVALYDVGQHAGVDYLAMAFVDGLTLGERLKSGPLPPIDAAQLIIKLATAVHHAHEHGVIHRDLKPSNVLLDKANQPHVTDFGLARRMSDSAMRATHTGQVLGTPAYMSPEQATGQSDIGPASDVYALGVILYETITGRPPFQAATFVEAVEFILNRDPLLPSKLNPKLPRELDAITFKCLEKRPANRYASAQELAEDLQCWLEGKPIRARTQTYLQKALRWAWKYPSQALLLVATLVLIGLLLTTGVVYERWQHADALAAEQKTTAETQRYFATVNQARNLITRRQPGWSTQGLAALKQAAAIKEWVGDRSELRQLAAECLTGFDVEREETISPGMLIGRVASSADGSLLAVGELKGNANFRVLVYDTATRKPVHQFTIMNGGWLRALKGEGKWQDGVREFAFTSDNRYLAAGLRFGLVYCFDLQNPKEPPRQLVVSKERELERMAFSADGKTLFAQAKDDGQFIRWQDWQKDASYDSPFADRPRSFAVSPFGNELFVSSYPRGNFKMMNQSLQQRDYFSTFASLPFGAEGLLETDGNGSLLATRSEFGLQVFETHTGRHVRRLQDDAVGDESVAHDMKFSRDGQLLTTFHDRGVLRFFDVAQSRQVMRLDLPRSDFQDFAVDPERRWVAIANNQHLEFWRLRRQQIRQQLISPSEYVEDMAISPSGAQLACLGANGIKAAPHRTTLRVFDTATGALEARVCSGVEHMGWSLEEARVAWSSTGKEIIAGTRFGTQIHRSMDNGLLSQGFFPLTGPTAEVKFEFKPLPAGLKALATAAKVEHPLDSKRTILQVTPRGQTVVLKCRLDPPVKIAKQQTPMLAISIRVDAEHTFNPPLTVQTNLPNSPPHRAPPWTWLNTAGQFQSWSIGLPVELPEVGEFELHFESQAGVRSFDIERVDFVSLGIQPGGKDWWLQYFTHLSANDRVWTCNSEEICSWSWPGGEKLSAWENPNHQVTGAGNIRTLQAGRDGTLVGTRDGRVHWLDPQTGKSKASWPGAGGEVVSAALCEEAGLALVGSETGTVRCLSIPAGKVEFDFAADDAAILALAATPDARMLVTISSDRMLNVWQRSPADGRYNLFCRLPSAASVAKTICLSADGKQIAVLGRITGAVELWNLSALEGEFQKLGIE